MTGKTDGPIGLTTAEALALQKTYGKNELAQKKKESFLVKALHTIAEPMFLLLIAAAVIYFVLGEPRDGAIMLIFVIGVISIDIIQEWKTDKTLGALRDLSAPHIRVVRDGRETVIASAELVPGDLMLIYEGEKIPADGAVIKCSDLCEDESSLTGESEGVWKVPEGEEEPTGDYWRRDWCYAGTLVTKGSGTILVEKTGPSTEYGKIGTHVAEAPEEPTPLQKQTGSLVRTCAVIAGILFVLVGIVTWFNIPDHNFSDRLIESILSGITLAMAMIPEEFPVILTVFLSLGAWRLAKKHSLVRRLPSVETLGAVSVLCVDKTGTITMNQMTVQSVWAANGDEETLCETMGLGCETDAYDPMERAMLDYCKERGITSEHLFAGDLIKEYPFTDELKVMGHVWRHDGELLVAAKGSPEKIISLCKLTEGEHEAAISRLRQMSGEGLRVIAIATRHCTDVGNIPDDIRDVSLTLLGLVGLADPPRQGVERDIAHCRKAGIRVVMITGDNGLTAAAIAKKIGMEHTEHIITGDMLNKMTDEELREEVKKTSIFSRVIPEHKMRIVKAFRDNGEVVAMTGDGVNDAPALKYAHIGIAMGGRGSQVSREAADLIFLDDNFTTIVESVRNGRSIYDNIRKAVGYVFTIHIPIALSSLLAPFLGISPGSLLLLPLHVVLLELVIDPTCSVVLERQPAEANVMERPPRSPEEKILNVRTLGKSLMQGLVIFVASFGIYYLELMKNPQGAALARSMGLAVILLSNILLVQVNSSEWDYAVVSLKRLASDKIMWLVGVGSILMLFVILYSPLNHVLKLAALPAADLLLAAVVAFAAVGWYEVVKLVKHMSGKRK